MVTLDVKSRGWNHIFGIILNCFGFRGCLTLGDEITKVVPGGYFRCALDNVLLLGSTKKDNDKLPLALRYLINKLVVYWLWDHIVCTQQTYINSWCLIISNANPSICLAHTHRHYIFMFLTKYLVGETRSVTKSTLGISSKHGSYD
jgi:hypothetical protein